MNVQLFRGCLEKMKSKKKIQEFYESYSLKINKESLNDKFLDLIPYFDQNNEYKDSNGNIQIENNNEVYEANINFKKEINIINIHSKLESICMDIKFFELYEILNYENIFFSNYLKVQKKNIEYLELYILSLKNTKINLFYFWRKIATYP